MEFPQLSREILTTAARGVKVREGQHPLTTAFASTMTNVEGDIAVWDEVLPITTLDTVFESREGLATNTSPGTVRPRSTSMTLTFKKREIKPEIIRNMRAIGAERKATSTEKLGMLIGDMQRRYYFERMEFLIASALQDNLSFAIGGITHTPDFGLAAGHDITAGASWATASTDIDADIETIRRLIVQDSGWTPRNVMCGRNIFGYLRKNSTIKDWFTAREGAPSSLASMMGQSLSLYGMNWYAVDNGHGVGTGSWTPYIPDDKIIVHPDPSQDWFQIQHGTVMAPNEALGSNPMDFTETFGVASWARFRDEPPSAWYYMRWAGIAIPVFPAAIVNFDTTP